jgi:hypothetical protein
VIPDDGKGVAKHSTSGEAAFYPTMNVRISTTAMRPFGPAPPGGTIAGGTNKRGARGPSGCVSSETNVTLMVSSRFRVVIASKLSAASRARKS